VVGKGSVAVAGGPVARGKSVELVRGKHQWERLPVEKGLESAWGVFLCRYSPRAQRVLNRPGKEHVRGAGGRAVSAPGKGFLWFLLRGAVSGGKNRLLQKLKGVFYPVLGEEDSA